MKATDFTDEQPELGGKTGAAEGAEGRPEVRGGTSAAEGAEIWPEVRGGSRPGGGSLLHGKLTGTILGAFYSVHTDLGFGFLESVYRNALAIILHKAGLNVEREAPFEIWFRSHLVGIYRADLVVDSKVIVEVKSAREIIRAHTAQLLNYLKASGLAVGLILNFGETATFKRVISTHRKSADSAAPSG